jgi:CheY-like chemotaxis protein
MIPQSLIFDTFNRSARFRLAPLLRTQPRSNETRPDVPRVVGSGKQTDRADDIPMPATKKKGLGFMSRRGFETAFITGHPLRVLMVEDSPSDAELSLHALRRHGYNVCADIVSQPDEFTDRLSKAIYDVVLSDYDLPDWNGLEVLEQLEKLEQDIPFILVTGALDDDTAAKLIDKGADDYVLKDRLGRLPLAVRRVLREKRLLDERKRAAEERERLMRKLQETLAEVRRINGLLPVCVTCKRILSAKGYWSRLEIYIERYSEARVSPSLCPDCASKLYPESFN